MKRLSMRAAAMAVALMLATTGSVTMTAFAEAYEAATEAQETVVAEQADEASSFEETEARETEAVEAAPDDANAVIEDEGAVDEAVEPTDAAADVFVEDEAETATETEEESKSAIESESETAVPDETGLVKIDGAYYMVLEGGTLYRGAYEDDSLKAFFDENDGHMLYGQRKVAGKWYQYSTGDDLWVLMAVAEKTSQGRSPLLFRVETICMQDLAD